MWFGRPAVHIAAMKNSGWQLTGEEVPHPDAVTINKVVQLKLILTSWLSSRVTALSLQVLEDLLEDRPEMKEKVALVNSETGTTTTFRQVTRLVNIVECITVSQLNEAANRLARQLLAHLRASAANPNSDGDYVVGLRFLPSEALVITILALFKEQIKNLDGHSLYLTF